MKTILLADDNKRIRDYCRRAMEEEGYRVLLARDGADAVRLFVESIPDAVVLDISMPGMNGLEALERLKQIEPLVPVILFTAYECDCADDRRSALAQACLAKSADLTQLKQTIGNLLAQRRTGCQPVLHRYPAVCSHSGKKSEIPSPKSETNPNDGKPKSKTPTEGSVQEV